MSKLDTMTTGSGILRKIRAFRKDNSGIAAMEFALIAPIMIGLYFMLNETANGLRAARKVTMGARVTSDLTSQATEVTDSYRDEVFSSITPIMLPFPGASTSVRLTSVRFVDVAGTAKGYVDWSVVKGTGFTAHPRCRVTDPTGAPPPEGVISVPNGLKVANTSVILSEVSFGYKPVIGWNITGTINLQDQLYTRPRTGEFVVRTGNPTTACPV